MKTVRERETGFTRDALFNFQQRYYTYTRALHCSSGCTVSLLSRRVWYLGSCLLANSNKHPFRFQSTSVIVLMIMHFELINGRASRKSCMEVEWILKHRRYWSCQQQILLVGRLPTSRPILAVMWSSSFDTCILQVSCVVANANVFSVLCSGNTWR